MELTIDHIASEIMCWCAKDASSFKKYWTMQNQWKAKALTDLEKLFNKSGTEPKVKNDEQVYKASGGVDFIFNPDTNKPDKIILAELICESFGSFEDYQKKVSKQIKKLNEAKLKDEYKEATRYLISMYHNLNTRNFLHDNNFIEIFNNLEIGCAIKRIK